MTTINGISFQDPRNINLKGGANGSGVIRFSAQGVTNWASNPFVSTDYGLYINSAGNLVFSSLGSTTVLGAAGAASVPTWEQIFASDSTFNVAGTTWTIDNSTGNNDVLTITNSGAGSGDTLQITNVGTGKDVNGSSSTWFVTKAGASTFLSVDSATIQNTTGNIILKATGAGTVTIGANSNTITIAKATTFSSTITVTDGLTSLISTSNTAQALLVTNNTQTSWGSANVDEGMVTLRSTSITSGALLKLQAAEGTITGYYLNAYDSVGTASVFSIRAKGATVIAGSAFATAALTLTAGDAVISSGKLLVTAASNSAAMAVFTNNTAASVSVLKVAGSGTFTGVTTNSFVTVAQTGGTAGTTLYVSSSTATNSVAVLDLSAAALTTGSALRITPGSATIVAGGKSLEINHGSAVAGNGITVTTTGAYTGTGMILVTAGAATTGAIVSVVSTTGLTSGSLIRATTSTAGALITNGAISFTATGAFTSNSAVDGGFVEIKANSTTAGTITNIVGTALTTGIGLQLSNGTSAITSGSLVRVTASGTGTIATNGIVSITHAGVYVSTATAGLLDVRATALVGAGTVVNFVSSAASQTAANIMTITQSGATLTAYTGTIASFVGGFSGSSSTGTIIGVTAVSDTAGDALKITNNALTLGSGTLINLVHGTSVIGAGSSMLRITSTGADTGTTTGCLLDLASSTATAGTLVLLTSATMATGSAMVMNLNGLTTGAGLKIAHTTTVIASGGSLLRLSSTSVDTGTTTGTLLDLASTATTGTVALLTQSAGTTGIGLSIVASGASQTSAAGLSVVQSATTSGFTGSLVVMTGSSTTGSGNVLGITAVNTSAGDALKIVSNSIVTGTSTAMLVSHTTSVLGAGNSLVRISSTSVDTGTTTGVLFDMSTTSAAGSTQVMLTDSSADVNARFGFFSKVTNTAAVLAQPFRSSNVAVSNSKFTKHFTMTDGTKTCTIWLSQDNTSPNTVLTGLKGDICLNGTSGATFYCTADGTGWATMG